MLHPPIRRLNSSDGRWERSAVTAWCIVLLIICVRTVWTPERNTVYPIFVFAGQNWLEGNPLYGHVNPDLDVFRYSPLTAAFFVPWSLIPEAVGNVLWRVLNTGVLLGALLWWRRELLPAFLSRKHFAWLLLLVLPMAIPSLNNGQVNLLMIGLLLAAAAAVKKRRFPLAAALVAVGCWLKFYPIAFGLLLVLLYPRRFSGWFALALGTGFLLPFLLQSPQYVWGTYVSCLSQLQSDNRELLTILDYWPRDIRLLFKVWWTPLPSAVYTGVQLSAGLVIAVLCWLTQRRHCSEAKLLLLTTHLCSCWMTVLGPATESATYSILAPSLATSLLLAWTTPRSAILRTILTSSYVLFVATYMAKWFPWGNWFANFGPQPVAGLIYLCCLIFSATATLRRAAGDDEEAGAGEHELTDKVGWAA